VRPIEALDKSFDDWDQELVPLARLFTKRGYFLDSGEDGLPILFLAPVFKVSAV
jgi:hypothetical protein